MLPRQSYDAGQNYPDGLRIQMTDSPRVPHKSIKRYLLPALPEDDWGLTTRSALSRMSSIDSGGYDSIFDFTLGGDQACHSLTLFSAPFANADAYRVQSPAEVARSESTSGAQYVDGYKLAGLVAGMTVVIFLVYLDNSIISTATPVITADLHETADIGWYAGAYTLVS